MSAFQRAINVPAEDAKARGGAKRIARRRPSLEAVEVAARVVMVPDVPGEDAGCGTALATEVSKRSAEGSRAVSPIAGFAVFMRMCLTGR